MIDCGGGNCLGEKKGSNASSNNQSHCFEPFISPNPITSLNPVQRFPKIDKTAFVSQFSSVIGDVSIRNNV
jgi:carbon dioxide concentrating mechanism protein CcmM